MVSRKHNMRPFCCFFHFGYIYFQTHALIIMLPFDLVCHIEHTVGFAQIDDNVVVVFFSLDQSGNQLILFFKKFIVDNVALRFFDFLNHELLCVLCRNTPKVLGIHLYVQYIACGCIFFDFLCILQAYFVFFQLFFFLFTDCFLSKHTDIPYGSVDNDRNFFIGTVMLFICRNQCRLNGSYQFFFVDPLFFPSMSGRLLKLFIHLFLPEKQMQGLLC